VVAATAAILRCCLARNTEADIVVLKDEGQMTYLTKPFGDAKSFLARVEH